MKRPIVFLAMAVAVALLSNSVYAEDKYECQFRCSNEKYDRNINCPSSQATSTPSAKRDQCLKSSQVFFDACSKSCPPAPKHLPCDIQAAISMKENF